MYIKTTKGFTLLEVLIAISILAIIISTIFVSYTGTFRLIDDIEDQAEIYGMARIALNRMIEDLECSYLPKLEDEDENEGEEGAVPKERLGFVGKDEEIKERSADSLSFLSRADILLHEDEKRSTLSGISYEVRESQDQEGLTLYRRHRPELAEESAALPLCDGLYSVNFTYYDADGVEHRNWDSKDDDFEGAAPALVFILIEFINKSNPELPYKFMTKVMLPISREYE